MQPVTKLSASPAARLPPAGYFQPARHAADEGRGTAISSSFGTEKSDAVRRGRERPRHAAPAPNRTARERRRARWAPRGHIALPSPAVQQNGPGYRETVTGRATRGPRGSPPPAEPRAHRAPPARHAAPRAVGSPPGARSRGDDRRTGAPRPRNREPRTARSGAGPGGPPAERRTFVALQHVFVGLHELLLLTAVGREQPRHVPGHGGLCAGGLRAAPGAAVSADLRGPASAPRHRPAPPTATPTRLEVTPTRLEATPPSDDAH